MTSMTIQKVSRSDNGDAKYLLGSTSDPRAQVETVVFRKSAERIEGQGYRDGDSPEVSHLCISSQFGGCNVGCPFCKTMLSDGLTQKQGEGLGENVEIQDVSQMLLASVKRGDPSTNGHVTEAARNEEDAKQA